MPDLLLLEQGKPVFATDQWKLLSEEEASALDTTQVAQEKLIWPLEHWQNLVSQNKIPTAVCLRPDQSAQAIAEHCAQLELVALQFPVHTDGRAFSTARLLRNRYQYKGQLRAVGDFMLDQLFYISRCGFDAFALPAKHQSLDEQELQTYLKTFSVAYQDSADDMKSVLDQRKEVNTL